MTRRARFPDPEKFAKMEENWKKSRIESMIRNQKCKEKDCKDWRQPGSSRCINHSLKKA